MELGDVAMDEDIALGRGRGDAFGEVHGSPNIQPRKHKMEFNATLGIWPFAEFTKKVGSAVFTVSDHRSLALKSHASIVVTTASVEVKGWKQVGSNRATTVLAPNL